MPCLNEIGFYAFSITMISQLQKQQYAEALFSTIPGVVKGRPYCLRVSDSLWSMLGTLPIDNSHCQLDRRVVVVLYTEP